MTTKMMIVMALWRRDFVVAAAVLVELLACTHQSLRVPIFGKVVIWQF